ncbi:MAG: thioredoxin-dependent thiol peroxidase [Candidatus Woesearchaeota archaeon]
MSKLKFTDKAPDFILPNQDKENVNLRQFRGKWVVLYFYPRDNTPGCSLEAHDFTVNLPTFKKLNAVILGVSKDDPSSHCSFIKSKELKIILLSDEDHKVQESYGVWQPKTFMGREFLGTIRMTFLIDPNGRIAHIWDNVRVSGHVGEVLSKLKELEK